MEWTGYDSVSDKIEFIEGSRELIYEELDAIVPLPNECRSLTAPTLKG